MLGYNDANGQETMPAGTLLGKFQGLDLLNLLRNRIDPMRQVGHQRHEFATWECKQALDPTICRKGICGLMRLETEYRSPLGGQAGPVENVPREANQRGSRTRK